MCIKGKGGPTIRSFTTEKRREEKTDRVNLAEHWKFERFSMQADDVCSGPEVPENGHKVATGGIPGIGNKLYHVDGFYIRAAACFIYKRYKSSL